MTYKLGNYNYVLFRSKEQLNDIDPNDFYAESQVIVAANNQTTFTQATEAKFHEFLICRIESSTEIKILKRFVHPYNEIY